MTCVLIVDDSRRDAERVQTLLQHSGWVGTICQTGFEAQKLIQSQSFAAALVLWDISGPLSGFELLNWCKQHVPSMPVIVMSGTLDVTLAARAFALGARDFLEKPVDSERVKDSLDSILNAYDPSSPLVALMRKKIVGQSMALIATLKQVARVLPHDDLSVLLVGESGTGKELLARAIHELGSRAAHPWVAVNVGEIASTLIESALFGHEKGAFTGASDRHKGFIEEAQDGTLFLDEIGDLALSLQGKLLRVIQEREFRRLKGQGIIPFRARLICATNRDLVEDVKRGSFRRDLFHRIAEVTIQVPPLREREGDVELLLKHFIGQYAGERPIRFARETLTILRSYTYPGNIRELDNLVKSAIVECDHQWVLPKDLPLQNMGAFVDASHQSETETLRDSERSTEASKIRLLREIENSLPENWFGRPYRKAIIDVEHAFDRVYLERLLEESHHNISRAASKAEIDTKTFRKRWRDCGLASLVLDENSSDD